MELDEIHDGLLVRVHTGSPRGTLGDDVDDASLGLTGEAYPVALGVVCQSFHAPVAHKGTRIGHDDGRHGGDGILGNVRGNLFATEYRAELVHGLRGGKVVRLGLRVLFQFYRKTTQ